MPNLYIISGPNGAGKTTASFTIFNSEFPSSMVAKGKFEQLIEIENSVTFEKLKRKANYDKRK